MNAPFANLFLSLQARIAAGVTGINHIAHDLGQLSVKARPPVSWPCVLIDFEDFAFTNLAENVQQARGTVLVRLGFAPYSPVAGNTPDTWKEAALAYYDLEWALHKVLQGWAPEGQEYGSLCRIAATTQCRTDSYRVRELRYSIAFDDCSTRPVQQFAPAELVVGMQIL